MVDNMVRNGGKQQALGLARAVRKAWEDTRGAAVAIEKDCLWVCGLARLAPQLLARPPDVRPTSWTPSGVRADVAKAFLRRERSADSRAVAAVVRSSAAHSARPGPAPLPPRLGARVRAEAMRGCGGAAPVRVAIEETDDADSDARADDCSAAELGGQETRRAIGECWGVSP